jgi:hypothetical protein
MRVRPWFLLYRTRLLWCAGVSVAAAFLYVLATAATICDCQPPAADAFVLSVPFTVGAIFVAGILAIGVIGNKAGAKGFIVFQFTRPAPRQELLLLPLSIGIAAIVLLPVLGWVLVLEGIRLFEPVWLSRLVRIAELMPAASGMGAHPALVDLFSALHLLRRWMAASSVGLCVYAVYAAQRWFLLSDIGRLNLAGALISILPAVVPLLAFIDRPALSGLLLFPSRGNGLAYLPTTFGIGLHLAFAAALLAASWQVLRRLEV